MVEFVPFPGHSCENDSEITWKMRMKKRRLFISMIPFASNLENSKLLECKNVSKTFFTGVSFVRMMKMTSLSEPERLFHPTLYFIIGPDLITK